MAAQGPENTIEVKVIISKCGPDTSGATYTRLHPYDPFSGHTALISFPEVPVNTYISSKTVAQCPEITIKVKVILSKCGPDNFGDDYIHHSHMYYFSGHKATKIAE